MDLARDIGIINNELIQKDLQNLTKKLGDLKRKQARNPRDVLINASVETLEKAEECLRAGIRIYSKEWKKAEVETLNTLLFITSKPMVYLINLSAD